MRRRFGRYVSYGVLAAALAVVPLAGCSTANLGAGSFGSGALRVAEVPGIGDYTAERALAEARAHFRNNDFGHSAAFYKRVVELSPKDPEGYVGLGASYDRLRRFDLSDRVYAALFALGGGTAQYHNNVGYSHMLRGDLKTALTHLRKAEALAPGNAVVGNNLQILARTAATTRA